MELPKVLLNEEEIQVAIKKMAKEINEKYKDKEITLICILKGGVMFFAELSKHIESITTFDFMHISSYANESYSSGNVKIVKDLDYSITDKHVVVVEDIIDTGYSLGAVKKHLLQQNPKSLEIAVLLDKPSKRESYEVIPDYIGFEIPDKFVVGFGLDLEQKLRNLPYIGYYES